MCKCDKKKRLKNKYYYYIIYSCLRSFDDNLGE